jgi:hypothetical protein
MRPQHIGFVFDRRWSDQIPDRFHNYLIDNNKMPAESRVTAVQLFMPQRGHRRDAGGTTGREPGGQQGNR